LPIDDRHPCENYVKPQPARRRDRGEGWPQSPEFAALPANRKIPPENIV
jgi:hypothetical protein